MCSSKVSLFDLILWGLNNILKFVELGLALAAFFSQRLIVTH